MTIDFRETFGGTNLNRADHIAVGKALLDAVRDARNRWIFPEQLPDGLGWEGWDPEELLRGQAGSFGWGGPIRYGRIISLSSCSTMWQCQTNWPGWPNRIRTLVTWPG